MKVRQKIIVGIMGLFVTTIAQSTPDLSEIYTYYNEWGGLVGGERRSCSTGKMVSWGQKTDNYTYEEEVCNPGTIGTGPVIDCGRYTCVFQ